MDILQAAISIAEFRRAIDRLPSDAPRSQPGVWYRTQKEHWLGWLGEYDGPGAYGRKPGQNRDARFAYNHIVCPDMLLWLIEAAGVRRELVTAAHAAAAAGGTMMQRAGAIRRHVPWTEVRAALLGERLEGIWDTRSTGRKTSFRADQQLE